MNNEILINEINFKKFSKRLLKEIKSIDSENINLSETHNILSRVLSKKDYNDIKKSFKKKEPKEIENRILNPNTFLKNFISNRSVNMAVIEVANGDFSLSSGIFGIKMKNDIETYVFSKTFNQILDKDISMIYLNFINNNLSKTHLRFNVRYEINDSLKINEEGSFLKIYNEEAPFTKRDQNFKEIYIKSRFNQKENTYKLFIAKCNNFDVKKL